MEYYIYLISNAYYSKRCDNNDKNTEAAILCALLMKRLYHAIVLPYLEILMVKNDGIFLKDLNLGNISITKSAELVCRIFSYKKRIFYEDTEKLWTEFVHDKGVFYSFRACSG
jgi:hypothetical protein